MPLHHYGVWKGRPIDCRLGTGSSPHYQVLVTDNQLRFRIAINVKSQEFPSELKYIVVDNFIHPLTDRLQPLAIGFHSVPSQPDGLALDFIRGNLFQMEDMRVLPPQLPGPNNDLNEKLDFYIREAMGREDAFVYAFGERWGPEDDKRDQYFGFLPGNGIHDIHQNQGNVGRFIQDDGVWQDGGVIIHYEEDNRFVGIFLAFQSQATHTDDVTGHALPSQPGPVPTPTPPPTEPAQGLYIIAAYVNPPGADRGEQVLLLNTSDQSVNLQGWAIADKQKKKQVIQNQTVAARSVWVVPLDSQLVQLSNEGGIITLLDPAGLKVHGVSYTREQAVRQGWLVKF